MKDAGNVLLLGANGQLGVELQKTFAPITNLRACTRADVDLGNPDQIRDAVAALRPFLILNAAAYTAVDRAELEPELAAAVNARGPRILAEEAKKAGSLLVHYSTDYVFDGSKPGAWNEEDSTGPLNVYGKTKLAGEQAIVEAGGKHLIFRTSWLFSPHGRNFMLTILQLARQREELEIVDDQFGGPTSAQAVAEATKVVVDRVLSRADGLPENGPGLYHMTCGGSTSWCGFAAAILELARGSMDVRTAKVKGISSGEYPCAARRPRNSVLSNRKLNEHFAIRLPDWQAALAQAAETFFSGGRSRGPVRADS